MILMKIWTKRKTNLILLKFSEKCTKIKKLF